MLSNSYNLGNTDAPSGLTLYSNDYMHKRKASEFKQTVYIFYFLRWNIFKIYLYHTSIFYIFSSNTSAYFFFLLRKKTNFEVSFILKEHK